MAADISTEKLREKVVAALKTVYDPELPVDIFELGLIYEINLKPDRHVELIMTLTSPACPVAGTLPVEVKESVEKIPEVKSVKLELTFDPPWNMDRMSDVARIECGFF